LFTKERLALGAVAATAVATLAYSLATHAAPNDQEGWSTQAGGTAGGSSSTAMTVTSLSAPTSAAGFGTSERINVNGTFSRSADVTVASNKTIVGVGSSSGLTGCGLEIKGVNNVIVRNLKIAKVLAGNGNGDAIHVEKSTHIQIDHNDLSSHTSRGTDRITHGCTSWDVRVSSASVSRPASLPGLATA
jgi:pectate lyase